MWQQPHGCDHVRHDEWLTDHADDGHDADHGAYADDDHHAHDHGHVRQLWEMIWVCDAMFP